MATGIIGAFSNGALTYTAPTDAKLSISFAAGANVGSLLINGIVAFAYSSTNPNNVSLTHFVGAGQTVTISVQSYGNCIVSVLEGS